MRRVSDQIAVCLFKHFHGGQFPDGTSPYSDKKTKRELASQKNEELDRGPVSLPFNSQPVIISSVQSKYLFASTFLVMFTEEMINEMIFTGLLKAL